MWGEHTSATGCAHGASVTQLHCAAPSCTSAFLAVWNTWSMRHLKYELKEKSTNAGSAVSPSFWATLTAMLVFCGLRCPVGTSSGSSIPVLFSSQIIFTKLHDSPCCPSPSGTQKVRLEGGSEQPDLVQEVPVPHSGSWTRLPLKIPFKPYYSVILWCLDWPSIYRCWIGHILLCTLTDLLTSKWAAKQSLSLFSLKILSFRNIVT